MFSTSTYGNFNTPVITPIGMITGMGIDGNFVMRQNPVVTLNDFFRPRYQEPKFEGRSFGAIMEEAILSRHESSEKNLSNNKEAQLNELKAQVALAEEHEKKLQEERAKREAAEKALAEERAKKLAEEQKAHKLTAKNLSQYDKLMRKLAMKNLSISSNTSTVSSNKFSKISSIKSSGMSTVSSTTSVSKMSAVESVISDLDGLFDDDETEITFSDSASNTGSTGDSGSESESESESESGSNLTNTTIIRNTYKTIDPNEKSRFSNCTRCVKCFNGVSSVGCIIVGKTNDDHIIFLGKNVAENAYCDYSQKLKSIGKRCELPSERAEKIVKRLTDIDYDIDQHHFIDIPIKDNLHVHRVYIIDYNSFKTKLTINVTTDYNDVALFSMNNIRDHMDLYQNKKLYDNKNNLCDINKRIQKVIEIYYNYFC
jgi:hypothetical protein